MSDDDFSDQDFASLMSSVKKLDQDKVNPYQHRPQKQRKTVIQTISQDEFQVATSDRDFTADSWFDHGIQRKLKRQIKQGQIRSERSLDLHGYRRLEAQRKLRLFVEQAGQDQVRLIIVVHGKGLKSQETAIIKPMVLGWLSISSFVLGFCPALPKDGGSGASYVYLRTPAG
ncbi:MAG: DNA-nicking Smr family endonuclease [Gammaproteobacteria bacterium]|jgi:DNA-nicking Smr family endonuclease